MNFFQANVDRMNNYQCFESNTLIGIEDPYIAVIYDLPSAQACQNYCQSDASCSYWSYGYYNMHSKYACFLKDSKIGKAYKAGYTSGPDVCL